MTEASNQGKVRIQACTFADDSVYPPFDYNVKVVPSEYSDELRESVATAQTTLESVLKMEREDRAVSNALCIHIVSLVN